MAEGKKTALDPGLVARVAQGLKYAFTGKAPEAWFGPGEPMAPVAPEETKGRQFDYPVGWNLRTQPRGDEAVSFGDLRSLAHNCDLVRLVIETRKDQLCKLSWTVRPKEEVSQARTPGPREAERQAQGAYDLLKKPDRVHRWNQWLRMLVEDMLVIDAATVYPRPTKGGGLYALEVMDGATIKPILDESGRTPLPPEWAYIQVLKGMPACNYTREELIYFPRNPLSWRVYGLSPVEQIILIINIILRRQLHLLQYYTEGNLPDSLLEVPENWSAAQIAEWQQYWDSLFAGNTAQRRKGIWVPQGMKPHPLKEAALKDPIDEWFARVVCYCFSVSPQPFVHQINRATAETAQEMALAEGLAPLQEWVADLANEGLERGGFDLVEFAWEEETAVDPKEQAEINEIYERTGIMLRSQIRESLGLEDDGVPDFIITAQGPVLVAEIGKTPEPPLPQPSPPGGEGDKGAQAGKPAPPVEKLKKAAGKKKVKRLDRDRPEIKKARKDLTALLAQAFKEEARAAAAQIADLAGLAKTQTKDEDLLDKILRQLRSQGIDAIVEEVQQVLARAAQNGGLAALAQINIDDPVITRQVNQLAVEWAQKRAAEMVGKKWVGGELVDNPDARWAITDTTRDLLRGDVAQAMEEGWSSQQLADKLEANYAFSEARAEAVARTEIANADAEGNFIAYQESGVVEGSESILGSEHGDQQDECDDNADAGVVPLGEPYPSGHLHAPYHTNCICDNMPVLIGEGTA